MSAAVPSDLCITLSDYLLKTIVVGAPGAGKSSLILRFADDVFTDRYFCTIGIEFVPATQKVKKVNIDGKSVILQVWDGTGSASERYRSITQAYYRNTEACLVVVDLSERWGLQGVEELISETRKHSSRAVIKVVGCKSDLQRKVSQEELLELTSRLQVPFIETSAKEGTNVNSVFLDIAKEAIRSISGKAEHANRNSG